MTPLYSTAAVRRAELSALARRRAAPFSLMRKAGMAVARAAQRMTTKQKPKMLALAGPGNNGGDALVAAAALRAKGWRADVILCAKPKREDAVRALQLWQKGGGKTMTPASLTTGDIDANGYDVIIDGLFGIGGNRPMSGEYATMAKKTNAANAKVLAIDVPSGINADTGGGGECIMATQTITFFADKPGLHTGKGIAAAGKVIICTLGEEMKDAPMGAVVDSAADLTFGILRRRADGHKGDYGSVCIIGGDDGMAGALALAARACVRLGAGKVRAMPLCDNPPAFDTAAPEVMWQKPTAASSAFANGEYAAIAIGTGLGKSAIAKRLMMQAAASTIPLVVDADGLNLIAADDKLRRRFAARKGEKIITPHPAEAARLLGCTTAQVQEDRITAAKLLAKQTGAYTILKGAGTIVASPKGEWQITGGGNPGLAQGGSGDVLTGMTVALLAQTKNAPFAAAASTYLHATAADQLAKANNGVIGININKIPPTATKTLNTILQKP